MKAYFFYGSVHFRGEEEDASAVEAAAAGGEGTKYPALTQEEVEEWLEQIPIFAVTDANGAGVVLKPDSDTSVFYFFFSPQMANATLTQLKDSGAADMDLRISAFSLGKIWFKILNSEDKEVMVSFAYEYCFANVACFFAFMFINVVPCANVKL